MIIATFTIPSPPRTKKNHGRVIKRGGRTFHVPSRAFEDWNKTAQVWLTINARTQLACQYPAGIAFDVNCRALFFREALRGDAVGYYQALADALEENGIVENDKWIVSWDGSRLLKDSANPRIEVTLETTDGR